MFVIIFNEIYEIILEFAILFFFQLLVFYYSLNHFPFSDKSHFLKKLGSPKIQISHNLSSLTNFCIVLLIHFDWIKIHKY